MNFRKSFFIMICASNRNGLTHGDIIICWPRANVTNKKNYKWVINKKEFSELIPSVIKFLLTYISDNSLLLRQKVTTVT